MYEDKTLVCKDCGNEFVFTAGEQEFYAERDLSMSPSAAKLAVAQEKPPLAVPVKCTTLFAPTAAQPARFPLSRGKTVRFIAASALRT